MAAPKKDTTEQVQAPILSDVPLRQTSENLIERAQAEARIADLEKQLSESRAQNAIKDQQLSIATNKEGVSPELAKDIAWRISCGLSEKHATVAALAQLASDIADQNKRLEQTKTQPANQ